LLWSGGSAQVAGQLFLPGFNPSDAISEAEELFEKSTLCPGIRPKKERARMECSIYEPVRQREVMTGRKSTMRKQIGAHVRGRENDCFRVRLAPFSSARGSHKTSGTIEISLISLISLSLMFLPISCVICSRTAFNSGVLTLCPGSSRSVTTRCCILGRWEEQSFFFRSIIFFP